MQSHSSPCGTGSDAVTLQAVVVDVASSTIEAAADAANDCMNQGADVVVGPINMPDLATAVFLAGIEGMPELCYERL